MDNPNDCSQQSSCNGIPSEKKNNFIVSEDHGQKILSILQNFREQNVFYDFKIIMKDEIIPCHRCVLAACSDFFRYFTLPLCPSDILMLLIQLFLMPYLTFLPQHGTVIFNTLIL